MAVHVELPGLIGKPIVVYKDGKRFEVGTITAASYDHEGIHIKGSVTDEELGARLKADVRKNFSIGG